MKKPWVVAALVAVALAIAPITSVYAGGRHNGGYYGGPLWGLGQVLVATAAAIITAPIAVLAADAQAPLYYGPAYSGSPPAYNAPPAGPISYGAPTAPPGAPYYASTTTPAQYAPIGAAYYAPPPAPVYYAPPAYNAPRQAYYAPRPAHYGPSPRYYPPPPPAYYYPR